MRFCETMLSEMIPKIGRLHGYFLFLVDRVYMFDDAPAINAPMGSFVRGPSFLRMPGFAWSKRRIRTCLLRQLCMWQ